jgi:hypothetical protein
MVLFVVSLLLLSVQMVILFFGPETGWIAWASVLNFNAMASGGNQCMLQLTPVQQMLTGLVSQVVADANARS